MVQPRAATALGRRARALQNDLATYVLTAWQGWAARRAKGHQICQAVSRRRLLAVFSSWRGAPRENVQERCRAVQLRYSFVQRQKHRQAAKQRRCMARLFCCWRAAQTVARLSLVAYQSAHVEQLRQQQAARLGTAALAVWRQNARLLKGLAKFRAVGAAFNPSPERWHKRRWASVTSSIRLG